MNKLIWLVVGKEMKGNHVVRYCFLCLNNNNMQWIQHNHAISFIRKNEVLNASTNGDNVVGNGFSLSTLPKFVKQGNYGLVQVSGGDVQQVIDSCQHLINAYQQKQNQKNIKAQSEVQDKNNKLQYIVNKLQLINNILKYSIEMKDLTNAFAAEGELTRYLKQIDLDNSEYDPLTSLVKTSGVNGLATGLNSRLDSLLNRATKYGLQSETINGQTIKNIICNLKNKCEQLKKLHTETKNIIKDNKETEKQQIQEEKQAVKLEKQAIEEEIEVVSEAEAEEMLAIDEDDVYEGNI